ncbi:L,D-transpeptidase family protein [Streptomyces sp. NPDC000410]|uniref:L,D-transpeptidase family protein n=1 Tax=Streptomyces sp. NPDC000410 TaxID=3154254 RepID=UPI0033254ED2
MRRTSVLQRTLMAAMAVALAAGCTAQGTGGGASATPSKGPATPAAPVVDDNKDDDKPAGSPSPSGSGSPSAGQTGPSADTAKVLMQEGTENEQVRELQARLRQLGYFHRSPTAFYGSMTSDAVRGFQEKRGLAATGSVDETTWTKLTEMSRKPTADELRPPTTNTLDKPDERCMTGRVLCISKESRTLAWMIDGKVISAMDVRFGSENTPTREGIFKVDFKSRDHVSTLYDTPMPYAMFFSRGQAVHYSSDFAARGYNGASHGCVNVRDKGKIAQVFDQVKAGDKVVVHW